jgi:hypothetical protein
MSVLNKLTEGIVNRDMRKEGAALLSKWEKTGLLEGITDDNAKNGMARLLENQAKELLREAASSMAGGDVEGFASVAFPIVRRVFGGLIANDLVSVQPMSLPSGLIFFLDFTYGDDKLDNGGIGSSSYDNVPMDNLIYGTASGGATAPGAAPVGDSQANLDKLVRFDPDLLGAGIAVCRVTGSTTDDMDQLDVANLIALSVENTLTNGRLVRRLTQFHSGSTQNTDPSLATFQLALVFEADTAAQAQALSEELDGTLDLAFAIADNFNASNAVGSVVGAPLWALEDQTAIPEINIKVDSVAVTAQTKKLKAKWTPELGQDLNAYHNLDAEVELTSILSEQIALEIDREILEDLINGATAGTLYWSRSPGLFVNRETGAEIGAASAAPDFTGTVSEWYETLIETINDVSARIHRKTLRGGANFVVCGPEVANILEFTAGFRGNVTVDGDRGEVGAVRVGQLSKKMDVYVDPYFPRSVVLVGRRGGSFLESGYVYAPYVPLQVTPTIFGIEDFVPRKGVMTRYAKKMVRPDMYGLVICRGLIGEAGATS